MCIIPSAYTCFYPPLAFSIYSDTKRSLSDHIGDESQKFMRSNVAHFLVLTVDSIIGLNGGLKQLLAFSTNLKLASSKVDYTIITCITTLTLITPVSEFSFSFSFFFYSHVIKINFI